MSPPPKQNTAPLFSTAEPVTLVPAGKIRCYVHDGVFRKDTPEEHVRQRVARSLVEEYGYDRSDLHLEFPVKIGSGRSKRADIAIFRPGHPHKQDNVFIVVEAKREDVRPTDREEGIKQLKSYLAACINADWGLWVGSEMVALEKEKDPILDKERQGEIDTLDAQNSGLKDAASERDKLSQRNRELESELQSLQSEKSRQDDEIAELNNKIEELRNQKARKIRHRYLREQLGEFLAEGKDISWDMNIAVPGAYQKYKNWLERVKQFLSQEDEFDRSHLARFDAKPLDALVEFIKEFTD